MRRRRPPGALGGSSGGLEGGRGRGMIGGAIGGRGLDGGASGGDGRGAIGGAIGGLGTDGGGRWGDGPCGVGGALGGLGTDWGGALGGLWIGWGGVGGDGSSINLHPSRLTSRLDTSMRPRMSKPLTATRGAFGPMTRAGAVGSPLGARSAGTVAPGAAASALISIDDERMAPLPAPPIVSVEPGLDPPCSKTMVRGSLGLALATILPIA